MSQLNLFESPPPNAQRLTPTAHEAAEQGMQAAVDHADAEQPNWSDDALDMVRIYFGQHTEGMVEDIRAFAESRGFTPAPSARAWGPVIRTAAREGIVVSKGYAEVKNPKAHKTPATVWQRAA